MSDLKSVTSDIRLFKPSKNFSDTANINSSILDSLNNQAMRDYPLFWANLAKKHIHWHQPFTKTLNEDNPPFFKWFEDGVLNVSYNCLDRHLANNANKTAIISESDSGITEKVSYKELHSKVSTFANGLKSIGITKGDTVIIYMPHSIEAIVAMQACARIGAIHSVVFGGFSSKALAERIIDASAKIVITTDGQKRGGKVIPLKNEVDIAINMLPHDNYIQHVIIYNKISYEEIKWDNQRDIWWHELIKDKSDICPVTAVESEHPLFILYTSGSTGSPKGVQHSSGGYLLGAIMTMQWVFDNKPNDVFWCTADVGWITGHTYVCYGPLAVGATQVIFEGVPTYPAPDRFWQIIQNHKVSVFYTAPTAIRTLIKLGHDLPQKYDLSTLRLLGSVGEPINPEAWLWYYEMIGNKNCPIVDTWWQTETGCHMLSPIPGVTNLKAGSCTNPIPGVMIDIIDESGKILCNNDNGYLVITKPFPSQIRTIWNNPKRYEEAYYPKDIGDGKYYIAGDLAHKDKDGYFWILGRIDDVLNVSGHRLGTMEIESALALNPIVAEAAVVGRPHDIKGEAICAFVVCRGERPIGAKAKEIESALREWIGNQIGAIAKPDEIRFGDNLPKTRSGKIMRRLLRSLAKGDEITQDVSTLENPAVLEQLKQVN
jgi:acetyl-CoA synthetase